MSAAGTLPARWRSLVALAVVVSSGCTLDWAVPEGTSGAGGAAGSGGFAGDAGRGGSGVSGSSGQAGATTAGAAGQSGSTGDAGPGGMGGVGAIGEGGAAGLSGGSGQGGAAGLSGSSGQSGAAGQECSKASDCDDGNPCTADECQGDTCAHLPVATTLPQTPGDCRDVVCVGGKLMASVNDSDPPADDGNPCTNEQCNAGVPVHTPLPSALCQIDGKPGLCNAGVCEPGCQSDKDCDDGNPCTEDMCGGFTCYFTPESEGSPTPGVTETPGDCMRSLCQGGVATVINDLADQPADLPCMQGACNGPNPGYIPAPEGSSCNGNGTCTGGICQTPVCGDGKVSSGEQCDDMNTKPGDGCSAYCMLEPAPGMLVITEVMINPKYNDASGTKEWFEIHNTSATTTYDLRGLRLTSNGTESHVIDAGATPLLITPKSYAVLGRFGQELKNIGVPVLYAYGSSITFDGLSDQIRIEAVNGFMIDQVTWSLSVSGGAAYQGATYSLSPTKLDATSNDVATNWCPAKSLISASNTDRGTPGKANDSCP